MGAEVKRLGTLVIAAFCGAVAILLAGQNPLIWKQSTFEDFVKGRFGDAGANTYVSRNGKIQTINQWDLNSDGFLDLVFTNTHSQAEKLDAVIYWGNGKDFSDARTSPIPNEGAQWTVAADLNGDGVMDAVIPNYTNGTWSDMDSAVYYGGKAAPGTWSAPPFSRKIQLPTRAAQQAAVGDLNRDGYPDIVFALSAGFWEYRGGKPLATPSRIYWGSKNGYDPKNYADVESHGASDVAIADLNKDGWPDLVIANRENEGNFDIPSFVYWGGKEGFSPQRRTELPTHQANAVCIGDVDNDGYPDIVFANGQGGVSYAYLNRNGQFSERDRIELATSDARDCGVADLNKDGYAEVVFTNHQAAGNPLTLSYIYWGSAHGFSNDHRQGLETIGATGLSIADLNEDGLPDIVISNYEEEHSYDVPSYIYWNSKDGFSDSLRTSVFTHGAVGNTVADFNGDGHVDIIFNNTMSGGRGGESLSYIYWGNAKGEFSVKHRTELPAVEPYNWAAGDLNNDGYVDLIFANMAEVGRHNTENFIYWGGKEGFSKARRTALVGDACKGVSLADLDRDGYLDVVFYCQNPNPKTGVLIYWGGKEGFVTTERTGLPNDGDGTPTIADLNYDGNLDLVVHSKRADRPAVIYWGDGTRNYSVFRRTAIPGSEGATGSEVADLNRDGYLDLILTRRLKPTSFIYYGDARGTFSVDRRQEFVSVETQGVTVADIDKDGWLDVVCPVYKYKGNRATLSRIYFGGPDGISNKSLLLLPTNGGTGSQVADYNHDGYNDLLLISHRSDGDPNKIGSLSEHETDSLIYWGGKDGFRTDRTLKIPTRGAHFDNGVDLGNIYDRKFRFDYESVAYEYGDRSGDRIDWRAETPFGSKVSFQVRTASTKNGLASAKWTGPGGEGTYYEEAGSRLMTPAGSTWIQYRAVLESPDGADFPVLSEVVLSFR